MWTHRFGRFRHHRTRRTTHPNTRHIGTGRQGRKHIRLASGLPGFDIRTVCDVLPFQLDEARKLVGPDTKEVSDYRYILDDPEIDAVVVATPFHLHAKPMLDALDAGKHVYCEKTLVKGHDQIAEVREVVAGSDRIIQAGGFISVNTGSKMPTICNTKALTIALISPMRRAICNPARDTSSCARAAFTAFWKSRGSSAASV